MIDSSNYFSMSILERETQKAYDDVIKNFDSYEFEPGRAEYMIEIIGSSAAGIYMLDEIIEDFGIPLPDYNGPEDEFYLDYWDDVQNFFDDISADLNERIPPLPNEKEGYNWFYSFGFSEGDGSYCLFIIVEKI